MSISSFSSIGQNELIERATILPHIKAANQIYLYQTQRISLLEDISQKQDAQSAQLTLGLNQCISEREATDKINANLNMRIKGQEEVIKKQNTIIKIIAGIAASVVTYSVIDFIGDSNDEPKN